MPNIPSYRYLIETWGCQMNVHDSEKLSGSLARLGFIPTNHESDADLIILNTCSVRDKAQEKVFSRLGQLTGLKHDRNLIIGVAGCVAQQEGEAIFLRAPDVDFVIGTQSLILLPEIIKRVQLGERVVETGRHPENLDVPPEQIDRIPGVKAYITIMEGCDNFCTFCVVPFTRGRERCRTIGDIVKETESLTELGFREIQLLGQNVNSYLDPENGRTFSELIDAVHMVEGIDRIRFTSPHPKDFEQDLMERFRDLPKLCPHMHLPVQSGSTSVLARMNRGYSRNEYIDKVGRSRVMVPELSLTTDLIVGFPGETEAEFLDTLTLMTQVGFDGAYSFKYSERPATFACREQQDSVSEATKCERLSRLQNHQKVIQTQRNEKYLDQTVEVLVEGPSRKDPQECSGRNLQNRIVNFSGLWSSPGDLVEVRVTRTGPNSLKGVAISSN